MTEAIIEQLKENDRKAQKLVYEKLFGKMNAVCVRYVKDRDDAMEVTNNAFFKVFKNIHQFKNQGSFEGWVKRITINTALDYLKEIKNYKNNVQIDTDSLQLYNGVIDNRVISKFNVQELLALVELLPPMAKTVFNLYAIDGYQHKDIADMLNINEVTSRTYLHAARNKLKQLLIDKNIDITL